MKRIVLPERHYASGWKNDDFVPRPAAEITELARAYAELPDEAPAKQEKLLEICREFHPYLMKYLVMICRGHVPVWGAGQKSGAVNKDIKTFIQFFLPKGSPVNKATLGKAVRHLHLAFKGMEAEEIYDVLMEQFLKAVRKYDPRYTDKVKQVAEVLDEKLKQKEFTVADVNDYIDFDGNRYLRMLHRRGFLMPVYTQGSQKRVAGYSRTGTWPPPASLFENGAIGFAYYLQTWFRRPRPEGIHLIAADGIFRSKNYPGGALHSRGPPVS